ncbi:MAG: D-proline reductase (dithiol) PrdB [Gammaproteobacteria bacterium]|jgi:D-proline reductase (dithiol) PrdB
MPVDHVRYIDKTTAYYATQGYDKPYAWSHFDTVPFSPLAKPLSKSRVALLSTSEIAVKYDADTEQNPIDEEGFRSVYAIPADTPNERLYSRTSSFDANATNLDDVASFFPADRMREALASGRIASMPDRFYGAYNNYSQRKVLEKEAPKVLEMCREDNVDVAVLVPV